MTGTAALMTGLSAEQEEYARTALDSGRHLLALINDVLDFSKIEAGRMEIRQVAFDIRQLVGRNRDPCMAERRGGIGSDCGRRWLRIFAGNSPEIPLRLRQVVITISSPMRSNLRKRVRFPGGHPVERSSWKRLRLAVRDTGIGLPDDADQWLKPFSQADGSITPTRWNGTRTGHLQRLAEGHGWRNRALGAPGKGSEFWFTIPLVAVPEVRYPTGDRIFRRCAGRCPLAVSW